MSRFLKSLKENNMSLIVSLPQNDSDMARAAEAGGAHAVKVHARTKHRASGILFGSLEEERENLESVLNAVDIPVGIAWGETMPLFELESIGQMGFDFIDVYIHHAEPILLQELSHMAKMFAVSNESDISWVCGGMKKLGCDVLEAAIVSSDNYGERLTIRDLLAYMFLAQNTDLPIVVPTQRTILPEDLASLKHCGVRALMIGVVVLGMESRNMLSKVEVFSKAIRRFK